MRVEYEFRVTVTAGEDDDEAIHTALKKAAEAVGDDVKVVETDATEVGEAEPEGEGSNRED